jgi:hypothetical protein
MVQAAMTALAMIAAQIIVVAIGIVIAIGIGAGTSAGRADAGRVLAWAGSL